MVAEKDLAKVVRVLTLVNNSLPALSNQTKQHIIFDFILDTFTGNPKGQLMAIAEMVPTHLCPNPYTEKSKLRSIKREYGMDIGLVNTLTLSIGFRKVILWNNSGKILVEARSSKDKLLAKIADIEHSQIIDVVICLLITGKLPESNRYVSEAKYTPTWVDVPMLDWIVDDGVFSMLGSRGPIPIWINRYSKYLTK